MSYGQVPFNPWTDKDRARIG
ncbi:uncharacterized protein FFM5_05084 [Fusarium fujikuroi]|nr:uncharacterized protein FFM5_05084 [Fusarium fujikuroi]